MKERLRDPVKESLWNFFKDSLLGVFKGSKERIQERDRGPGLSGKAWKKKRSKERMTKESRRRNRR